MFDMAGGYSFIEKISESKYTTQYRVRKEGEARTYLARSLASSYASPSDIALFKHAFEKVKSHSFMGAVTLYDLIEYNNNYVIVGEDFSGVTLKEFIRTSRTQKEFDISSVLRIGITLADVLSEFHGKGIIHMALRPDNIIYNENTGDLRIYGFGFEKIITKEGRNLYYPGYIDSVLPYLSPEQTGRMNRTIDYRTDLYSLGVILYQLIRGEVPFRSMDPLELIHSHIAREPLNLINCVPGIPQALSKIVMKLLAKNAEDRYQSGFGVKVDLSRCMSELADHGSVDDFNIGMQDNSGRFQIPQKLYGRKEEFDRILSAFETLDRGMSSLVLVVGEPGIGKTVLINEIHKPVVERRGYFVSGKYEQYLKDRPYSAIILAFSRLIRQVLSEGEDRIDIWRNVLLAALGSNGRVISAVIPDLDMIIGEQPDLPEVGAAEQHNRFNMTFLRFIRVFANNDHPLVLFLDDLQWADYASVQLIRTMLSDPELKNILLVCAYRESDVISAHIFKMMMQDLDGSYFSIYNITLSNLLPRDLCEMVIDTFRCDEQKANELTKMIFEKTAGNPFFVREFLKNLYQEKIIQFSFDGGWQWDIGKIDYMNATDNVVDLMMKKLLAMPEQALQILKIAACIGNRFELEFLADISGNTLEMVVVYLQDPIMEGLIYFSGQRYYFFHDRIQEATYSLIPEVEKASMHYKIGNTYLEECSAYEIQEKLLYIVNQLNSGKDFISNKDERYRLAELNVMAGKKAKASAAYASALNYLRAGLQLLDKDSWKKAYDLTLSLFNEAAMAAFLNRDYDAMGFFISETMKNAANHLDKLEIYKIKILLLIAQNRLRECVDYSLEVLRFFGVRFPKRFHAVYLFFNYIYFRIRFLFKNKEDFFDLTEIHSPIGKARMDIMETFASALFWVDVERFMLLVFIRLRHTLRYGYGYQTKGAFSSYLPFAMFLIYRGDVETATVFFNISLEVQKRFGVKNTQGPVSFIVATYGFHWKHHLRELLPMLIEAHNISLECGDIEYAAHSLMGYCYHSIIAGINLQEVEGKIKGYLDIIKNLKQEAILNLALVYHQTALNLLGKSDDPTRLIGTSFNSNKKTKVYSSYFFELMLCYIFEDYEGALAKSRESLKRLHNMSGTAFYSLFYFYDSLVLCAVAGDMKPSKRKRSLKRINAHQKKMRVWAKHAPMNYLHKYNLVEAERARITGDFSRAVRYYDLAIKGARENGFLNDEALAEECAARFWIGQKNDNYAWLCMKAAYNSYFRWGAFAKIADLERKYSNLIHRDLPELSMEFKSPNSRGTDCLDISSVIKVSQAISGEIVFENLLNKMMKISLENAGAQKVFLILEKDKGLYIEARGETVGNSLSVLESIPVNGNTDCATTIINYVARTGEVVVVADASADRRFSSDTYIRTNAPKSILCIPIMKQGKFFGGLYFENNLMPGVFTMDRIELLRILCSQAAIAIDNARLYGNLEEMVMQRTSELEVARGQVAQIAEVATGVLHNIGNLVNSVNISNDEIAGVLHRSKIEGLVKANELLMEHRDRLAEFLTSDERGKLLPDYYVKIGEMISGEHEKIAHESKNLTDKISVMRDIIVTQQEYARIEQPSEDIELKRIVEDALIIQQGSIIKRGIVIVKNFSVVETVKARKSQLIHVLLNLFKNASDAMMINDEKNRVLSIDIGRDDADRKYIRVGDNGEGIEPENLERIFTYGFTTKKEGHGFGLNMSFRFISDMGGQITVESGGRGKGSVFTIYLK